METPLIGLCGILWYMFFGRENPYRWYDAKPFILPHLPGHPDKPRLQLKIFYIKTFPTMSKETTTETEAPVQVENIGTMEDEPTFESKIVTEYGDVVAQEALGDNIPPGYYTSPNFLGTIFVELHPAVCFLDFGADEVYRLVDWVRLVATSAGSWLQIVLPTSTRISAPTPITYGLRWRTPLLKLLETSSSDVCLTYSVGATS